MVVVEKQLVWVWWRSNWNGCDGLAIRMGVVEGQ